MLENKQFLGTPGVPAVSFSLLYMGLKHVNNITHHDIISWGLQQLNDITRILIFYY